MNKLTYYVNSVTPASADEEKNPLVSAQYRFRLVKGSLTILVTFEATFAVLGHLLLKLAHFPLA